MSEPPDTLFETWGAQFKNEIVSLDVKDDVIRAFLRHLADLGVFHSADGRSWSMPNLDVVPSRSDIIKHLKNLCTTEDGFAVGYFLASGSGASSPAKPGDLAEIFKIKKNFEGLELDVKRPSDLSNLQIVKNTASRIQPFLELEKTCLDRLRGSHTTCDDAKILFNYILSKIHPKAEPLPWQQLSRRRHRKD